MRATGDTRSAGTVGSEIRPGGAQSWRPTQARKNRSQQHSAASHGGTRQGVRGNSHLLCSSALDVLLAPPHKANELAGDGAQHRVA